MSLYQLGWEDYYSRRWTYPQMPDSYDYMRGWNDAEDEETDSFKPNL